MNILDITEELKNRVKERGHYRDLSEKSGVGYEWIAKFAQGKTPNPRISSLAKLQTFFDENGNKSS